MWPQEEGQGPDDGGLPTLAGEAKVVCHRTWLEHRREEEAAQRKKCVRERDAWIMEQNRAGQ